MAIENEKLRNEKQLLQVSRLVTSSSRTRSAASLQYIRVVLLRRVLIQRVCHKGRTFDSRVTTMGYASPVDVPQAPEQRQRFAEVLAQLRRPAPSSTEACAQEGTCTPRVDMPDSTLNDGGGRTEGEDADIDFLREM